MTRLESIVSLVSPVSAIIDVGADHGYVTQDLLLKGLAKRVIVSDFNPHPLETAKSNIKGRDLSLRVDFRLGNGLTVLQEYEVEAAVIAGMGGKLIIDIIAQSLDLVKGFRYLVVQPMNARYEVRKWLFEQGLLIEKEVITLDKGKYYSSMRVAPGKNEEVDDFYFHYPRRVICASSNLLQKYISFEINRLERIVAGLKQSNEYHKDIIKLSERIGRYEVALKEEQNDFCKGFS